MKKLTAEDLFLELLKLGRHYDLSKILVTIGDDEELNGVHQAYFMQMVDLKSKIKDDKYLVEQCDEALTYFDAANEKFVHHNGKTFLIS